MSGTVRLWLLEFSKDSASACITVFALTVRLQIEQMTAQFPQVLQTSVNGFHVLMNKLMGEFCTLSAAFIKRSKKLSNFRQSDIEITAVPDEIEPIHMNLTVLTIVIGLTARFRQKPLLFVVADRFRGIPR